MGFLVEMWSFLRERRKYWLLPVIVMMMILGAFIIAAKFSAIAPFIYTVF